MLLIRLLHRLLTPETIQQVTREILSRPEFQSAPATEAWWQDLGAPSLTPELRRRVAQGVEEERGECTNAALAVARDDALTQLLRVKQASDVLD